MPTQNYEHARMILKSFSGYNDTNFCTVVSIACAFNWSAGKAHRLLAKHGRPHRRGPSWEAYSRALEEACKKSGRSLSYLKDFNGMTINRFAKEHPTGTYMIAVKGHVICLKDGEFQDWTADTAGRRKIGYRSGMGVMATAGVARIGD